MEKRCINVPGGPPPQGPYSMAVAAGNLLFLSGQIPVALDGSGIKSGTFEDEARLVLNNIKTVLEAGGSSLDNVVKVTVYLADAADFPKLNAVYKEFFPENFPARTTIQAGKFPIDIKIEIDVIAIIPG